MRQEKFPFGLWVMNVCCGFSTFRKRLTLNKMAIMFLTYWSYTMLHSSRKSFPVVKNTLKGCNVTIDTNCTHPGYAPFNGSNSITILSLMDTLWAVSYALFMFISGNVAERTSLRGFLTMSLVFSGIVNCLFGMAKYYDVHSLYYFTALQVMSGIVQSFGWPSIMGIMGYWFGHSKLGIILGIWNSNVYIGNILGQVISAYFVDYSWDLSFIVPGGLNIITAPNYIGFDLRKKYTILLPTEDNPSVLSLNEDGNDAINELELNEVGKASGGADGENTITGLIENEKENDHHTEALGFFSALMIPGVIEYSLSLFFSKLVTYTFLFWLPFYISNVGIQNKTLSTSTAGYMALVFDIGAIFGCFFIGLASDLSNNKSAIVCVVCQGFSALSLLLYSLYGTVSYNWCMALLIIAGFFTCAPSSLITTAVSTHLGEHPSLGSKKAKATIAAIIDGTGSIGSAIGPFIVSLVSHYGLQYLMFVMMFSVLLSALFLARIAVNDICTGISNSKSATRKQSARNV